MLYGEIEQQKELNGTIETEVVKVNGENNEQIQGGTSIIVGGNKVESLTFASDPQTQLDNKVNKVSGKGLSSNDYTDSEKQKLAGLQNYNDTTLSNRIKNAIVDIQHNGNTGVFTFTKENGSSFTLDTLLEKVVTNFTYNENTQSLELSLEDGTVKSIPMTAFIDDYTGIDGDIIEVDVSNDNKISAIIKNGTITNEKLSSDLQTKIDNKLDVITTTGSNRLYGVDVNGKQTMYGISTEGAPNTIARRTSSGNLRTVTPSNDIDCTNKAYVDEKLSELAKLDATNLSEENIASWKEALGVNEGGTSGGEPVDVSNKANVDASNLSVENIQSWKTILGVGSGGGESGGSGSGVTIDVFDSEEEAFNVSVNNPNMICLY